MAPKNKQPHRNSSTIEAGSIVVPILQPDIKLMVLRPINNYMGEERLYECRHWDGSQFAINTFAEFELLKVGE